jgi:hypothetical protein
VAGSTDRLLVAWILIGVIGWAGLAWIAIQLDAGSSAQVGFDLELLLAGARAIAAGGSPYDPAMLAGTAPTAPSLFYSYPPLVAQALVPFASVPSRVMLLVWDAGAVLGLLSVAEAMRRRFRPGLARRAVLIPVLACTPLVLPFAIGLLFGNLDVFFPLLYGAMLLAATSSRTAASVAGGMALFAAALKLHPASLAAWFAARAGLDRQGRRHLVGVLVVALVAAGVALALSLAIWGATPWLEYQRVVIAGTGAEIVDRRNAGIAVQLALLFGGGEGLARAVHLVVGIVAVAVTLLAAWRRADPLESFAWAAVASLATLPVTWYHYPSALIPIALAAILRSDAAGSGRTTRRLVLAAAVLGGLAIAFLPLLWFAAGLVILAARSSAGLSGLQSGPDSESTSPEPSVRGIASA